MIRETACKVHDFDFYFSRLLTPAVGYWLRILFVFAALVLRLCMHGRAISVVICYLLP